MELTVVAPCYNEEANIPALCARVVEVFKVGGFEGELVLVDDASRDRTGEVIDAQSAIFPSVVVGRKHERNRGIAEGWRTGVAAARGRLVCLIDADLQYQPEDILRLKRELEFGNADVVQGWRSPVGRAKDPRYYYSRGLNEILNGAFGMKLRDNKSGFVLAPREVLEDLLSYEGSYAYWQTFIMVAAHARGYRYQEIETLFEPRRAGQSFLSSAPVGTVAKVFVDLAKALVEYRIKPPASPVKSYLERNPPARTTPEPEGWRRAHWQAYLATFPLTHWMITSASGDALRELRASQWLPPEGVRELQELKLRRLVRHAWRHVPFYRERMRAAGIGPDDIKTIEDLRKLPMLSKDDVRKHLYFDIMSDNHEKSQVLKVSTSGSTGEPFVCFVDRAQLEMRWAATMRSMEWTGWRWGDRQLRLWHQTLGMTRAQVFKEKSDALLSRRRFVPVYEMNDEALERFVEALESYEPALIDGYAEAFTLLGQYLQSRGKPLRARPRGLLSSAQTLPEGTRRVIEEAFRAPVFDKYGAREFSGIAYECDAHAGHHVVAESYIVEVLNDRGMPAAPGELGEIVITDLNNFCQPFLRYRIGDLAEAVDPMARCACGRGLPRLGRIEGRVQSIILGADGQYVPGTFFAHLLKDYDHAIRQFQVVQRERGALTFRVVPGKRFNDEALAEVLRAIRVALGESLRIDVEMIEHVELVRTGKRVVSVSSLGLDFQQLRRER